MKASQHHLWSSIFTLHLILINLSTKVRVSSAFRTCCADRLILSENSLVMKSLGFFTLLLQLSLLTTNAFSCRSNTKIISYSESPSLSSSVPRVRMSNNFKPKMLPESTSAYDDFSYSPVDVVDVVAMTSSAGSTGAEVIQRVDSPQNSQHELSPQQFVYVILTR